MPSFKKQNAFLIAPSLLAADFSRLGSEVESLEQAGADALHWDVMDGHFVNNITLGPFQIQCLRKKTSLLFDVHLMIENPENYIDSFIEGGADHLTLHVETLENVPATLSLIRQKNVSVGLSLKPKTPVSEIIPFLDIVDLVLVMTVEPGFGGQAFLQDQKEKIKILKDKIRKSPRNKNIFIEVDGGINETTALDCQECDILVAGSYIFNKKSNYKESIKNLKNIRRDV